MTAACFVLKYKGVGAPKDEEAFITMGPLHPVPVDAPH